MDQLKDRIKQQVEMLDPEMIRRACMDVKVRCQKLISFGGVTLSSDCFRKQIIVKIVLINAMI